MAGFYLCSICGGLCGQKIILFIWEKYRRKIFSLFKNYFDSDTFFFYASNVLEQTFITEKNHINKLF